jgi:hypothetical protein
MFLGLMKMCAMDDTGFLLDVSYFLLNFGLGVVLSRFVLYFCRTKKLVLYLYIMRYINYIEPLMGFIPLLMSASLPTVTCC